MTSAELRFHQNLFAKHIGWLINFCQSAERQLTMSFGRAYDIPEVQPILLEKGLTSTLNSMHLHRLAVDFNFFSAGYYLFSDPKKKEEDWKIILPVGEYWESLDEKNVWGGRWKKPFDPYHFQRTIKI